MKPDDANGELPPAQRPFRVMVLAGMRDSYGPLVQQGHPTRIEVRGDFDPRVDQFPAHVRAKGKVLPDRLRAFGDKAPAQLLCDVQLDWRDVRMRPGYPRPGPSPKRQQAMGPNDDATLHPHRSRPRPAGTI